MSNGEWVAPAITFTTDYADDADKSQTDLKNYCSAIQTEETKGTKPGTQEISTWRDALDVKSFDSQTNACESFQ